MGAALIRRQASNFQETNGMSNIGFTNGAPRLLTGAFSYFRPSRWRGCALTVWAFALCFAAITAVSWKYLFTLLIGFSLVITLRLTAAAWLSAGHYSMPQLPE